MLNCDVYITHYKPLIERLDFMTRQLESYGIKFNIIDQEPHEGWIEDRIDARREKLQFFGADFVRPMSKSEISLAWKHYLFMKKAAESERHSLVLEDDALLSPNFVDIVNKILDVKDWDVVFPGSGCNLRKSGEGLIPVPHPASKCTDSYIVTSKAARKMFSTMSKSIDVAIDWELSFQMMHHDLRVCWLEPPIVMQMSQNGSWKSSINGKIENLFKN
jgi:GR25 family glycosyltransferase involved in LPS biosynthesis